MKTLQRLSALSGLLLYSLTVAAATPEEVVRNYAATWNAGDAAGFFALLDPDIHKFTRAAPAPDFRLTTAGLDEVRRKYAPLFAQNPRVHVEIVSLTTLGEMVVTRDRVANAADGSVAHEMTMYQVHDGRIVNIWYLGREHVARE